LTDTAFSLKHVLIPGSLQDQTGPNVATEFGVLLPEVNGDSSVGASFAGIVSQRWDWGTIHFNAAALLTRQHTGEAFASIIIEGPSKWTVRPVAESLLRTRNQSIDNHFRLGGLDLAGTRQSFVRCGLPACDHRCGAGAVDVLNAQSYQRIARIPTVAGARTSLFVPELDRLFLAARATSGNPASIWVFRPTP
jgi:hypothetical protein